MGLDLVVFGASGFTGRLVVKYLRRHAPPGLKWAIAGRDRTRLEDVAAEPLDTCSDCPPVDVIDGCDADGSAAERIVARAPRVVLSTAGPLS